MVGWSNSQTGLARQARLCFSRGGCPLRAASPPRLRTWVEGLILSGSRHLALHGQVSDALAGFDFRRAHLLRVTLVMEEDEAPGPIDIGIFSANGVVLRLERLAHLVEQFFGAR